MGMSWVRRKRRAEGPGRPAEGRWAGSSSRARVRRRTGEGQAQAATSQGVVVEVSTRAGRGHQAAQVKPAMDGDVGEQPDHRGHPGEQQPLEQGDRRRLAHRDAESDQDPDQAGLVGADAARQEAEGPAHVGDRHHQHRQPPARAGCSWRGGGAEGAGGQGDPGEVEHAARHRHRPGQQARSRDAGCRPARQPAHAGGGRPGAGGPAGRRRAPGGSAGSPATPPRTTAGTNHPPGMPSSAGVALSTSSEVKVSSWTVTAAAAAPKGAPVASLAKSARVRSPSGSTAVTVWPARLIRTDSWSRSRTPAARSRMCHRSSLDDVEDGGHHRRGADQAEVGAPQGARARGTAGPPSAARPRSPARPPAGRGGGISRPDRPGSATRGRAA